ncbi:MAG: 30S ribosomal protein S1 [Candidatus Dadabacteria bacterium]|nr:MAG: 30S ribosomal protein S1 [Candidatus Dadabacteria bacterium]
MTAAQGEIQESGSFATEFEKLLAEKLDQFKPGRVVPATVDEVGKEYVIVDLGFKSNGLVPVSQFQDEEGKVTVKEGDRIEVFIIALENDNGQIVVSYEKAQQKRVWDQVEKLFAEGGTVKGKIVQKVKGGLQVDIGIPAFLPGSQVDIRPHRNLDKFIGQEFEYKILKITRDKGNIVLSRRALLVSERDSLREETLKVLAEGVVMEGVVKNVTDYGAFIDLGGIDGLLHITDISWGRINHPADKLSVGETVPVVVLKYDQEKERVSLGMKQLTEDPWLKVPERYPVGTRVKGKVIGLTDYGAFVEVEEGVEGLVHVSDMSWTKKVRSPAKIVSEGEEVEAVVLGIDADQQRLSLGIKQLMPNPWEELASRHPIGSKVKGVVRSITEFGIFVGIDEGIDGLVHVSDFSWTKRIKDPKEIAELYKKGDEVEAVVLDIDAENERLSLGIKQLTEDPWDTIAQRYPVGSKVKGKVSSITDFGIFVEIEDGIEGLIHNSQLDLEKGQDPAEVYQVGSEIESEVTSVDREERRISLSVRAISRREQKSDMAEFMDDAGATVTFGDLLREKIDSSSDE